MHLMGQQNHTPDTVYAETNRVFAVQTPEQFTYDADGNMTSDGRFHYFWNGENRLVMASNDTVIDTYAYDHRGRVKVFFRIICMCKENE